MSTQFEPWIYSVMEKLNKKIPYAIKKAQMLDGIPYTVSNNQWEPGPFDGICWWTNGFWSALMWQMYAVTKNPIYNGEAKRAELLLDEALCIYDQLHHDVGFIWRISSGFSHQSSGDLDSFKRTRIAANLLAGRFNPNGFIRAWNGDHVGWAIIDCMMNLSLLYWASEHTGDPRFSLIAQKHADTVSGHFMRPDGSCEHIVIFDPWTGIVKDKPRGQGYARGSSWSRGQAWALYGFVISYLHTQKETYLETARRSADYFISCVYSDWLPDCDFRAPKAPMVKDDCAGSIAACGLIELAKCLPQGDGQFYLDAAVHLLQAMDDAHADWSLDSPAILTHCTGAYHSSDHHIAMVYADYFFVEAVVKLLGQDIFKW